MTDKSYCHVCKTNYPSVSDLQLHLQDFHTKDELVAFLMTGVVRREE